MNEMTCSCFLSQNANTESCTENETQGKTFTTPTENVHAKAEILLNWTNYCL